ncbi:MAG: glycosyltransferase family 4 protein [Desulfobaccales bacterium]
MKVTLSLMGRFWAFYLAKELQSRGCLERLITSYPVFETVKYGIDRERICSLVINEILNRGWVKAPAMLKRHYNAQYLVHELFDRRAARNLPPQPELLLGWSSFSLHTLRRARDLGARTVLQHGSSHIVYQDQILREEYGRLGLRGHDFAHPKIIDKELLEYQEADFISIPSLYVKETFLQRGVPAAKLLHVPYGVDLSNFYPVPKVDKTFRVIHCGNLSLRKGVHYLLQAFSELKLPGAELWLIGKVTDEISPFLKQYASPAVILQGTFPERELHKYFSQGSVFCLASIEEGLAMVQPMAMACGLPLIITTNTGGADLVREGREGFILPIRDVAALNEKILYCYENPEEARCMGEAGRRRVRTGFTWADHSEKMMAHFRRILAGTTGSGQAGLAMPAISGKSGETTG